jgi:DNA-binding NarL/FixJ family response regulator
MTTSFLLVSDDREVVHSRLYSALISLGVVQVVTPAHAPDERLAGYEMVIIDASSVRQPERTVELLVTACPALPVVVATAMPDWELARKVYSAGGRDCLSKLMDESKLSQRIKAILRAQSPASAQDERHDHAPCEDPSGR